MPYVPMICDRCRRQQERWVNSRFCSCGGRLNRCKKAVRHGGITFAQATGQVIRDARVAAGLTGAELARQSGLSKPFISDVENGKRGISLEHWCDVTCALGWKYTSLLGEVMRLYRGK